MLKKLAKIFNRNHRNFDTFQIEVSTYSSMECQVCPRVVFAEEWKFQNMPMETFLAISEHFHLTKWVSFRGWGDPMENEHLISMLRLAKEKECLTALTTNGAHLTEDLSRELLTAGLDILVVSVEWITQGIQEGVLLGKDVKIILERVEAFLQLKRRQLCNSPALRLSFPMTRLNMLELPNLVPVAAKLGVDEVIFANLDYLPEERWNILRTFYHESPTPSFQQSLDEIHRLGKELHLSVKTYPLRIEKQPVCEANPPRNVFFSVDGSVGPCLYLRIPKKGDIPRIFMNQESIVPQTCFGNIREEDFHAIWQKGSYKEFRGIFEERKKAEQNAVQLLDTFSNISSSTRNREPPKEPPPLPEVCQTCYKAYGV